MQCDDSAEAARVFLASAAHFPQEVEWFTEIALWDAECSVLSGNIEVRTPAFRFAYPVACSVSGGVFRRHGRVVPDGAPVGLRFPFQPRRTPVVPGRRGDAEARNAEPANADFGTGFAAAGFDSAFHMRSRYCTAVWEQSPILRRSPGAMLHLPCGDGLLLQLARDVNPGLVPFGLERDAELVNRARQRHSHHSGNFLACDWLSDPSAIWQEDAMLVFLDPEPLIDLPNEQRASLLGRLARSAGAIVLVGSDRGLQRYGEVTALARAIGIEAVAGPTERVSALAQVTSRDGERIVPSVYRRKAQRGQHD
jgi:hypothetical protein